MMSFLKHAKKEGSRYLNPVPTTIGGFRVMLKVLPLLLRNRAETEPKQSLEPFVTDPQIYEQVPASGLRVTWFGHSGLLLEIDGFRVLIDPVWEPRASPLRRFGPRRFFPPTLRLEDLPELDAVLISHDHYDHLGAATVRHLAGLGVTSRASWITSAGVGRLLRRFGVPGERLAELDWTQSTELTKGSAGGEAEGPLRVTAWPARHFSGRTLRDRFRTLWSSFVLEGPRHRIYFGADSGFWPGFAEIAAQYEHFDLTLLEIGAFHPLWAAIHLGPDGAAEAYRSMGGPQKAGLLFPIHWGLFNLALHGWREPMERLLQIAAEQDWPIWSPTPGLPTEVEPGKPLLSSWWTR